MHQCKSREKGCLLFIPFQDLMQLFTYEWYIDRKLIYNKWNISFYIWIWSPMGVFVPVDLFVSHYMSSFYSCANCLQDSIYFVSDWFPSSYLYNSSFGPCEPCFQEWQCLDIWLISLSLVYASSLDLCELYLWEWYWLWLIFISLFYVFYICLDPVNPLFKNCIGFESDLFPQLGQMNPFWTWEFAVFVGSWLYRKLSYAENICRKKC